MSANVVLASLGGFFSLLALKALSANWLYVILITLSIAISYGVMVLMHNTNDNKFKMPTGKVLWGILIGAGIIGLLSGLITIRLLYV
jgi:hypothetical protein